MGITTQTLIACSPTAIAYHRWGLRSAVLLKSGPVSCGSYSRRAPLQTGAVDHKKQTGCAKRPRLDATR